MTTLLWSEAAPLGLSLARSMMDDIVYHTPAGHERIVETPTPELLAIKICSGNRNYRPALKFRSGDLKSLTYKFLAPGGKPLAGKHMI